MVKYPLQVSSELLVFVLDLWKLNAEEFIKDLATNEVNIFIFETVQTCHNICQLFISRWECLESNEHLKYSLYPG